MAARKSKAAQIESDELFDFACPDAFERIARNELPICWELIQPRLNKPRADRALAIFELLKLPDVPGQPLLKDAAPPWQKQLVQLAAGGLSSTGVQRVLTLGLLVAKKNSKTSTSAGLVLTLAMMSPRPRAEYLLIGSEQSVALIAFRQLSGMIQIDPTLREHWKVSEHTKTADHLSSGVRISVKAFSAEAVTGGKVALALIDELHLLGKDDAAGRIIGQLRGGTASVPEAQLIWLSTQSDELPRGIWLEEVTKARGVRDGEVSLPGYCPILYEPPPHMTRDIVSASRPEVWKFANPSEGFSIPKGWLMQSFKEALTTGEAEVRRWLSQHSNVQVSEFAKHDDAWGGAAAWSDAEDPGLTFDGLIARADVFDTIVIGIDGGGLNDLLGLSLLLATNGVWLSASRAYCYEIALERNLQARSLWRDFERQGDLEIMTPYDGLQPVVEQIRKVASHCSVIVAADPNGVAQELAEFLLDAGVQRDKIIAVRQGYGLKPGYTALERRLRARTMRVAAQPVMSWAVSNAKVDATSGLISKRSSGNGKIDPLVALATAAVAAMDIPPPVDVDSMIGPPPEAGPGGYGMPNDPYTWRPGFQ